MKTQNINEDNTASSDQTSTAHAHQDKTRTIRRVLWWMGLVLLIPSLEGWTSSEDAFWIFREFPTPVAQYSNAVSQRIVTVLLVGFGCWCVVGLLKVTSVYDFARANFSQKQNRNGKTLTKILVAIVTICMSIIAGLSLIVLLADVSGTPL